MTRCLVCAGEPKGYSFRALEVQNQVGVRPPCGPGGGPVQPLQQRGALFQAGVGQIHPDACHPRLEHPVQDIPLGAGVAQGGVKFHTIIPFFSIMRAYAQEVNNDLGCPLLKITV